jgi:mucin-19
MSKKTTTPTSKPRLAAFTLIEVSLVILIVGLLIAGTFVGKRVMIKSRLAAAQSLARSSPIINIKDGVLWLETSLSTSIEDFQEVQGAEVSSWQSQGTSVDQPRVSSIGLGATYSNSINYVHAIKFDGGITNYLQISDASFLNNTDYTIFVLEKRQSAAANSYFLGETSSTANTSLALGYVSDGVVVHTQGNQSYTTSAAVTSYASSIDKARQFTFVHSATDGNLTYINGILAAQDTTKTAHLRGITTLPIGKGYNGEIGEIAIFTRALTNEERQSVEYYLGKKWAHKINRKVAASCISGIITDSGCKMDCAISIAGVSATSIAEGATTSLTCNASGYSGGTTNQTYSCSNGTLSPTPSATICTTSGATSAGSNVCAANYSVIGGICQSSCTFSGTPGITDGLVVPSTVGAIASVSCNAENFTKTNFVTYRCESIAPTIVSNDCSNNCDGNYTGITCSTCIDGYSVASGCTTCDAANNYEAVSNNCQPISCIVPESAGSNVTSVAQASGTIACNKSGYSGGPASYTCVNGVFEVRANACSNAKCTGGVESDISVNGVSYRVHKFTATGNSSLNCLQPVTADILVVGGGGASGRSGSNPGAGGGGGGVLLQSAYSLSVANYDITVGAGAAASGASHGLNGGSSKVSLSGSDLIVAFGGGGGAAPNDSTPLSATGVGSGGGGTTHPATNFGTGTSNQGFNGGQCSFVSGIVGTGGGGGAGEVGGNCLANASTPTRPGGGNGGRGKSFRYFGGSSFDTSATTINAGGVDEFTGSSTLTFYGGGGAGGARDTGCSYNGTGGLGGGGNVSTSSSASPGGTDGLGGGAGSWCTPLTVGSRTKGGSGVVIIRYPN